MADTLTHAGEPLRDELEPPDIASAPPITSPARERDVHRSVRGLEVLGIAQSDGDR